MQLLNMSLSLLQRLNEDRKEQEELDPTIIRKVSTLFLSNDINKVSSIESKLKQYIEENVSETEEKSLCGTGILIRKVYNKGFAFNSMDSEPEKVKKASVMTTAAIGLLTIIEAFREGHMLSKIALTFLSAGALSNTYDRVVRGKVVDYIGIKSSHKILGNITANLADIYILLGSVFAFLKKKID